MRSSPSPSRPMRWLGALALAIAVIVGACGSRDAPADDAPPPAPTSGQEAALARLEAATAELERVVVELDRQLTDLNGQLDQANAALAAARTDADREQARERLTELTLRRAELVRKLSAQRRTAASLQRSSSCLDNPRGC